MGFSGNVTLGPGQDICRIRSSHPTCKITLTVHLRSQVCGRRPALEAWGRLSTSVGI